MKMKISDVELCMYRVAIFFWQVSQGSQVKSEGSVLMSGSPAASAGRGADARTDSGALLQMICPKTSGAAATSGVSLLIIPVCPQLKASPDGRRRLCRVLKCAACLGKGKTKRSPKPVDADPEHESRFLKIGHNGVLLHPLHPTSCN